MARIKGVKQGLLRFKDGSQKRSMLLQLRDDSSPSMLNLENSSAISSMLRNRPASFTQLSDDGIFLVKGRLTAGRSNYKKMMFLKVAGIYWLKRRKRGASTWMEVLASFEPVHK
ncbi:hypothetical protein WG954_17055 [Lacibacter sp. H375]|uniref:hypothetical protein n=1 Tax=Lacibacter sp. H375 TaxID=3133424 RepID=UPI0030C19E0B